MPTIQQMSEGLQAGAYDTQLSALYGDLNAAKGRVERLISLWEYGPDGEAALFSAPGRTEIGGNHTDHNNGRVLAGAVNLDTIGLARRNDDNVIRLHSAGFEPNAVSLKDLTPKAGRSASDLLIGGICDGFLKRGWPAGGFDAVTCSDVPPGSGLSSSAALENLVCVILSSLYGSGRTDPLEMAKIGQYAENEFLKKPSGLMDQTASAVGGLSMIDFKDPKQPLVEAVNYNFTQSGHTLFIVGPIGSHANLNDEYAAIPREMRMVAYALGKSVMRDVTLERFVAAMPNLLQNLPDRAVLRAYHFLIENDRVPAQADALRKGDFAHFLHLVNSSGHSSYMYLQNVVSGANQGLGAALAYSKALLGPRGAQRVHGGGFAGTIQAFVPDDMAVAYQAGMRAAFGIEKCTAVRIRKQGAVRVV